MLLISCLAVGGRPDCSGADDFHDLLAAFEVGRLARAPFTLPDCFGSTPMTLQRAGSPSSSFFFFFFSCLHKEADVACGQWTINEHCSAMAETTGVPVR